MRNEVAVRNGREIQNNQNENYSVQEIANKIIENPNYYENLKNGFPQKIEDDKSIDFYYDFRLDIEKKTNVSVGTKLGAFRTFKIDSIDLIDAKSIEATHDGFFVPDLGKFCKDFDGYNLGREDIRKKTIIIGKIYFLEYDFFKNHQQEIENNVETIKKAKKEDEQRKKDKLLKDQKDSIEDIDDLLKDLDKYILDKKLPVIETLQEINDDLKVLYAQKDNLNDIKSIKDYKSHFENAYKEAKKNPELTDIIEQRMLVILKTFFEILGESKDSINTKISEIKTAGNDKKFAVEFTRIIQELNNHIAQVQNSVEKKVLIDFSDLKNIENSLDYLSSKKEKVSSSKYLENCKTSFELLFDDYRKLEICSENATKSMCIILNKFYDLLGFSNEQKLQILQARQKTDEERDFANKVSEQNETIKSLSSKIREFEVIVENNEPVKIELLQTLENLIKELVKQKDIIQNKIEIENIKVHFDAIFKDCKKKKNFSNSASLRMQEIEKSFDNILGKKKGFLARVFGK